MDKKTYSEIITEMEEKNIFSNPQVTYEGYLNNLLNFQTYVKKIVLGKDENEFCKIDEAAISIEKEAWNKGLQYDKDIKDCVKNLKRVSKEIAISMAGRKGEDKVAKKLSEATREDMRSYRNVYVSDGNTETEIDNIVVTKNGIIILEVKNISTDVTISEDGRILVEKEVCYHNVPIGEKMSKKRELLKKEIEREAKKRGLEFDLFMDSFIVFSAPPHTYINDLYHREKYCYCSRVPHIVDCFVSRVVYSEEEYEQLNAIINELETFKKPFDSDVDFADIKNSFAKAMEKLSAEAEPEKEKTESKPVEEIKSISAGKGRFKKAASVAAVVATVSIGIVAAIIAGKKTG